MKYILWCTLIIIFGNLPAQQMLRSTARAAVQIDSVYPFDIQLWRADSTPISSKLALPRNGRPTLLAFWLTTCYPCMLELEAYTQKYAAWQAETPFNLVAISTDFPQRFQRIWKVAAEKHLPFPVFWDGNREFREILPGGLNGLPQVFLFNSDGKLVWHHRKYYTGLEDEMFRQVQEAAKK